MDLTEPDLKLMHSYQAAKFDWDRTDLVSFLNNLRTGAKIDQCKFCPDQLTEIDFESDIKKIKFIKKS